MAIKVGDELQATTATGEQVQVRALGPIVQGQDFPVVWICTEAHYREAQRLGMLPEDIAGVPWPVDALKELRPRATAFSSQ